MEKTRITRGDAAYTRLIDEGWTLDHAALYKGYCCAGAVTPMQARKGFEFCRVHNGRCKNIRLPGSPHSICCQVTEVMRRKLPS